MAIRKILVPVEGSAAGRTVLLSALEIGRAHGAHIAAIHVRPDPRLGVPLIGEGMSAGMVEELIELTEKETATRAREAKDLFDTIIGESGLPLASDPTTAGASISWAAVDGRAEEEMARRGRIADLIVLGRPAQQPDSDATMILNTALFETGRPVLVAPTTPGPIGRRIAVAWNGSAEAARAVYAAMDFFHRAETIEVVAADPDKSKDAEPEALVEYLAWHGLGARLHIVDQDGSVGDTVGKAAAGADLVVMGAYSHSRLRELILGGVTRHMLEGTSSALLMAH
ncbi:MAG: universal stress protein [Rhodospirillales bacterium]|nr:universal stress protein [Rhodospirillales bacterium]